MFRRIVPFVVLVLLGISGVTNTAAQKAAPADSKIEAEISKLLRDYYNAFTQFDENAVALFHADDGFYFSARDGFESFEQVNQKFRSYFKMPEAMRTKFSYQIDDIRVVPAGTDTAIANYKVITKLAGGGTERELEERYTNVFAKRDGRWKLVAEHSTEIVKPVSNVVTGTPKWWIRETPLGTAERYAVTVDNVVKHGGNASASLNFACGDPTGFGSLAQSIAADEHVGKRIRFSGWLKSENADQAGLWMRLDGLKQTLGFDNMSTRPVKGTTDWKQYDIVLDVPPGTINILFGALLSGKGRVWVDDLKLETVGKDVPTTNLLSAEQMEAETPTRATKQSISKQPKNLDFENGAE